MLTEDNLRTREDRDAQAAREEYAHEYHELSGMRHPDPVVQALILELRIRIAAKIAAGEYGGAQ